MIKSNLKRIRKEKGYSKLRLARESGVSARTIEHIEYGISKDPKISTIKKLAKALEVSVVDLIA